MDSTISTVMHLIRTPKLTRFEPAQYWGGGPPGNSVVLNPFFLLITAENVLKAGKIRQNLTKARKVKKSMSMRKKQNQSPKKEKKRKIEKKRKKFKVLRPFFSFF